MSVRAEDDHLFSRIKDNGIGFDLKKALSKHGSIGLNLCFDLAEQVGGKLAVESSDEGTVWTLKYGG